MTYWIAPGLKSTEANKMDAIVSEIATLMNVELSDLKSPTRDRPTTECRQICMVLSAKFTKLTLKQIGKYFNRDHSTVCYAKELVADLLETDRYFRLKYLDLERIINA